MFSLKTTKILPYICYTTKVAIFYFTKAKICRHSQLVAVRAMVYLKVYLRLATDGKMHFYVIYFQTCIHRLISVNIIFRNHMLIVEYIYN